MKHETPIDSPRSSWSRSISILFFISKDKRPRQLREQENSFRPLVIIIDGGNTIVVRSIYGEINFDCSQQLRIERKKFR